MSRVRMFPPGFTRSGDSITKCLREYRDPEANYWYFHSNKLDRLLLLESDVVFACAVMFDLDPEIASYDSASGVTGDQDEETKFDFVVRFRDGRVEYCRCRRNAPRSGWKLTAPSGSRARMVTGDDVEESLYLFDNALMLSGAMTATRSYDRSLAYQAVLGMFSARAVVTIREILDIPDLDQALLIGALAKLLADGTLITDLTTRILTPRSEIRHAGSGTSMHRAALPGSLAGDKDSQKKAPAHATEASTLACLERTRRHLIPHEYLLVDWPTPDSDEIPLEEQAGFNRRKEIVEAYRARHTCKAIAKKFRVHQSQVVYFVSRCVTQRPSGGIYGFYALLKGKHLNHGTIKTTKMGEGVGGRGSHQWARLLERVEGLRSFVHSCLFRQDAPAEGINFDVSKIYGDVAGYLQKAGVGPSEYPFSNADEGRDAVARYCMTLAHRYATRFIQIYHGDTAGKRARQVGQGLRRIIRPQRAGSYVQCDYWRTERITKVTMANGHGKTFQVNLPKWYYALVVDELSSAALSGFPTLEINPSTDSLLECMDRFVHPEQYAKSEFYGDDGVIAGPCFAPELVPGMRHSRFDVIRFDNALCNLSDTAIRANVYHFGAAINFGPCYTWVTRAVVERVIGNIARLTGKMLGPESTVALGNLKLAVDQACGEHNRAPTERARHSSPVEALAYALDEQRAQQMPIPLPRQTVESGTMLDYYFVRPLRGDMKNGRMPYVQELGYRYSSKDLSMETGLLRSKGQPVLVAGTVKHYDARICYARIHEGRSLGRLLPDRKQDDLISVRDAVKLRRAGKRHKDSYIAEMARAAAQERQRPPAAARQSR